MKNILFIIMLLLLNMIYFQAFGTSGLVGKEKVNLRILEGFGGDFKLLGPDRNEVSSSNYRGKILLINFGYTYCPDVCPMTLSHLNQAMLNLDSFSKKVQVFFISIDPERDTPEKLKDYVPYFNSSFIGLTGSIKMVKEVAKKYGIHFFKQKLESEGDYFMAHMEGVFLIDQKGRVRGRYKTNEDLDKLISDIKVLIK